MNLIERRRQMMSKSLPYDAEIEYLEGTGTQYIDTLITYNVSNDYLIECSLKYTTEQQQLNGWDSGAAFGMSSNGYISDGFNNEYGEKLVNKDLIITYQINRLSNTTSILTTAVAGGNTYSQSRPHNNLATYAANSGYHVYATYSRNQVLYYTHMRLYYFKMYKNNDLVRDLIPVRVGQVGYMYDKVSGQLFGNQGTGDFVLGPDKN